MGCLCLSLDKKASLFDQIYCWGRHSSLLEKKQVEYQERLPGEVYGVGFDVFSVKYPSCTMIIMSPYGQLVVKGGQREKIRHVEYPEIGESNV